jgi:hypothetical protein
VFVKKLNNKLFKINFIYIVMNNSQEKITNYTEFNASKLNFTKLEENERSNGQLIAYPRYTLNDVEISLDLQLPWMKLSTYGIPTLNEKTQKYYKSDADRAHLRLPLDLSNPEVADFVARIKELDTLMESPEMCEKLFDPEVFGTKAKKYKYSPIFRESEFIPNPKNPSALQKPPYIKLKLDTIWPDNEIRTKIFISELDSVTNKRTRTKAEGVRTVDDFAAIVKWQSTIRCIARPFKMWAHPMTKKDPEFGIGWKLMRIEVEKVATSVYKSLHESDNFLDSDSDDELQVQVGSISINDSVVANIKEVDSKDKSRSIVDVDTDDSDDDEVQQTVPSKIVEIDSDDSDEDDAPTPSKTVVSKPEPEEESDEESEEEVVAPPPKSKKASTKTKK